MLGSRSSVRKLLASCGPVDDGLARRHDSADAFSLIQNLLKDEMNPKKGLRFIYHVGIHSIRVWGPYF